jgi:GDP-L-fucose synthase
MRTLITGSTSMIGRSLVSEDSPLSGMVFADSHSEWDLRNYDACYNLFNQVRPDYVIHLASLNGNISYNNTYPADIFKTTSQIAYNVLTVSALFCVKKVVSAISSCAYPYADLLEEENFFNGEPHPSIEAHGFAKRYIIELSRQLHKQHGLVSVGMCFNTCYGPNDNFDLSKTKVMGSLIRKIYTAKANDEKFVTIWGTGDARREFIYADDVAKMFRLVLDKYEDVRYPINVGCGVDISISDLAHMIRDIVGYEGMLIFDPSKPEGQMKKLLSNKKMTALFGEQSFTSLRDGIAKTVDEYSMMHKYF